MATRLRGRCYGSYSCACAVTTILLQLVSWLVRTAPLLHRLLLFLLWNMAAVRTGRVKRINETIICMQSSVIYTCALALLMFPSGGMKFNKGSVCRCRDVLRGAQLFPNDAICWLRAQLIINTDNYSHCVLVRSASLRTRSTCGPPNAPASYSRDPGFQYRPSDLLYMQVRCFPPFLQANYWTKFKR
jgi:hypothetical protein